MSQKLPRTPVDEEGTNPESRGAEFADRTLHRVIGAVCGVTTPNDVTLRKPYDPGFILGCCVSEYSHAFPYVWENILTYQDGDLRVNLLFNRASRWADVESRIPYEGRIDLKIKQRCKLSVRIPEWVEPAETQCAANDRPRGMTWDGRYTVLGETDPGDVASLSFPISERTVRQTMAGEDFTLVIKGNTVVFIDPPGQNNPFYQRAHYRENTVRWVERKRFVWSEPSLDWRF